MLIDGLKAQHKAVTAAAANQGSLHALQNAALDADLFADNEIAIGLYEAGGDACTEGLNVGIGNRDALSAVADDLKYSGRLEDTDALAGADMDKKIGRKQGQDGLDALTVFPDTDGFVSGEEGLHLTQAEMAHHRFLILRHGEDGIPAAVWSLIAGPTRKYGDKGGRRGMGNGKFR